MNIEQWGLAELDVTGRDVTAAIFGLHGETRYVEAFSRSDQDLLRFSPDRPGRWSYQLVDRTGAEVGAGELTCTPATADNHGPVVLAEPYRFGYADGTPHLPLGTRLSQWHRQDQAQRDATVRQLQQGPFTKIIMDVVPEGSAAVASEEELDRVEEAVVRMAELGIQTELVLLSRDLVAADGVGWADHLRRVVARFAAYRTISWCLASDPDCWRVDGVDERFFDDALRLLAEVDHGQRLRTIRAGLDFDFGRRLITHCSLRHDEPRVCSTLTQRYRKPVVVDDLGAEGDEDLPAHSRSAEDLVNDIWEATCRGGAGGHAEFYRSGWSRAGGELQGEAADRLAFLRETIQAAPPGLRYGSAAHDASTLEVPGRFYLQYLGAHRFRHRSFDLPGDARFRVEVLDTWNMTTEVVADGVSGDYRLELPRRLYNAVRITRC